MMGGWGDEDRGGGGIQDITYIFLRNFLIFASDRCILPAKHTPLKIPGLKRIKDVIYNNRYGCFSHTLPAKSLIRSKFQSFVI